MNPEIENVQRSLKREKRFNGLLFGLLAGLFYALAAWGLDGLLLSRAHAALPWLKFILGGAASILVFGLAGWLTVRSDSGLASLFFWLLGGIIIAAVTARLPFQGLLTAAMNLIDPELAQKVSYPFGEAAQGNQIVVFWAVLISTGLIGLIELPVVDAATNASTTASRGLALVLPLLLLALGGIAADSSVNEPLRSPIVVTNQMIQFALDTEGQPVDRVVAREMHVRSLDPVLGWIHSPRRLAVGSYDSSIMLVYVLVDFNGNWARCTVVNSQPSFCEPEDSKNAAGAAVPAPAPASQGASSSAGSSGGGSSGNSASSGGTPSPTKAAPNAAAGPAGGGQAVALLPAARQALPELAGAPVYTITLTMNYAEHTFHGRQRLLYTNLEDVPLDKLYFRLLPNGGKSYGNGSLAVSEVLIGGQAARTSLTEDKTALEVDLPAALSPGEALKLEMAFDGIVPVDFGGEVGYGIYNDTENVLALSGWYPILAVYDKQGWNLDPVSGIGDSVYSDMGFYRVDLKVAKDLVVAATGVETGQEAQGQETLHHYTSGPMRDFFIIMSPNFQVSSEMVDGVQVNSYFAPYHRPPGEKALDIAARSLEIYNQHFGAYPYTELDVVEAPMRNASGVEFPGIVLIGSFLYDDPSKPTFTIATAHEVAHQWWYNVVGNDVFDEPWLDEGLTTYTSSLYYEFTSGKQMAQGYIQYWQDRYDQLKEQGGDDQITQTLAHFEGLDRPAVYGGVVYTKAALFFNALRAEIGDEAFFKGLKSYYQANQFKIATGDDLMNAFEEAAGRQLDDFYEKWLGEPAG